MPDSASINSYSPVPRQTESYSSPTTTTTAPASTPETTVQPTSTPHAEEKEEVTGTGGDEVHAREQRDLYTNTNKLEAQKLIDASPVRASRYGEVHGRTPEEEHGRTSETQGHTDDPTEKFNNAEIFKATSIIQSNVGRYRG